MFRNVGQRICVDVVTLSCNVHMMFFKGCHFICQYTAYILDVLHAPSKGVSIANVWSSTVFSQALINNMNNVPAFSSATYSKHNTKKIICRPKRMDDSTTLQSTLSRISTICTYISNDNSSVRYIITHP